GDPNQQHLALEPEGRRGERQRASPLPGARLGRHTAASLLLDVVRLRHGRVRLVAARRANALVLVEDARARAELSLEAVCPVERGGAPEPVDVPDRLGNGDLRVTRDL